MLSLFWQVLHQSAMWRVRVQWCRPPLQPSLWWLGQSGLQHFWEWRMAVRGEDSWYAFLQGRILWNGHHGHFTGLYGQICQYYICLKITWLPLNRVNMLFIIRPVLTVYTWHTPLTKNSSDILKCSCYIHVVQHMIVDTIPHNELHTTTDTILKDIWYITTACVVQHYKINSTLPQDV